MKKSVLVSGGNGLVGSKFIQNFSDAYTFHPLDISDPNNPVDITNPSQVAQAFEGSDAKFVVHYAAFTDVTAAWQQNGDKSGSAYKVNVNGTHSIIKACEETGKHLIHISTAYVFDGKKEGLYTEADELTPIEWYGYTKAEAERLVTNAKIPWTILRIDQPFRSDTQVRPDLVRRIANGLKNNTLYPQFADHFFGPTYIDDFARVVDFIIRSNTVGLFNASSGEKWSDFEFAKLVNDILHLNGNVNPGDLDSYLKTVDRPYQRNTAMDITKLKNLLDFKQLTVHEALNTVKI